MPVNIRAVLVPAILMLALVACTGGEPRLLNANANSDSPDEFSVLPGKPLQAPTSYENLPEPTPGLANLTDATPHADAAAALGGRSSAKSQLGIPAVDGTMLAYASRHGVQSDIRETLADADLTRRRGAAALFFQGWFSGNRYFAAYRAQSLDKYKELARLRAAGISTPSAPPK